MGESPTRCSQCSRNAIAGETNDGLFVLAEDLGNGDSDPAKSGGGVKLPLAKAGV